MPTTSQNLIAMRPIRIFLYKKVSIPLLGGIETMFFF